jgi:hypothetical protein
MPGAELVEDVLVAILLSFLSIGLKKNIKIIHYFAEK